MPCRPSVPGPVCHAPHHSLLSHTHLLHPFIGSLHGPCGKLRLNAEAENLRLGRKHVERPESRVYHAVCLCAHACTHVCSPSQRKSRGVRSESSHHLEQNGQIWWESSDVIKEGQRRISAARSVWMTPLRTSGPGGMTFWKLSWVGEIT